MKNSWQVKSEPAKGLAILSMRKVMFLFSQKMHGVCIVSLSMYVGSQYTA